MPPGLHFSRLRNLHNRRQVYSRLPHVRVEALRIWEESLNASNMPSNMGLIVSTSVYLSLRAGCLSSSPFTLKGSPTLPPIFFAILREMGVTGFRYRGEQSLSTHGIEITMAKDFRHCLPNLKLNKSQRIMLNLRHTLLDSFLKDNRSDILSSVRSGWIVIIDVSDPLIGGKELR